MLSTDQLQTLGVFDWKSIIDTFDVSDILIGNGFSINLCNRLKYDSLCKIYCSSAPLEIVQMFDELSTTNFESLLDALNSAQIVNKVLSKENLAIETLKKDLKSGLIKTIQATHPEAREIDDRILRSLAKDLEPFKDIYTTNYDVFLYKIILASNTLREMNLETFSEFGDGFTEDIGSGKLGFFDFDYKPRNLIYLHGSLFIYNPDYVTYKIRKIDSKYEYIRLIQKQLDNDNFPVYVAEGTSDRKREAIANNSYLSIASKRLKRRSGDLISYGFSFSKSDAHIVSDINISNTSNIVVSIYPNGTADQIKREISRISNLFPAKSVAFFDSRTLFTFDYPVHYY